MSNQIITAYSQGGYSVSLDAESVTTSVGQGSALRQRVQISVRDVTTGTPTDVGDAVNNAIRVSVIGSVTTTGGAAGSSNVTVSQWTAPQVVSITGTVTQGTTPWTVTYSQGTQVVSLSNALPLAVTQSFGTLAVTQSGNTWLVSATQGTAPWVVTFSGGTQAVSLTTATPWPVTLTQVLVSATQGTNPWVVTFSSPQPVSLSQVVLSSNVSATTPTGPAVQVVRSLAELYVPIFQVVSTTAASATIIPGVSGKRIYVTGYHLIAASQTNVVWIDNAATPNGLTGTLAVATNSGVSAYGTLDSPIFSVVTPGNSLKISQSAAAILGGSVTAYQL